MKILIDISPRLYKCLQTRIQANIASEVDKIIAKGITLDEIKEQLKDLADYDTVDYLVDVMRILRGGTDGKTDNDRRLSRREGTLRNDRGGNG